MNVPNRAAGTYEHISWYTLLYVLEVTEIFNMKVRKTCMIGEEARGCAYTSLSGQQGFVSQTRKF